jgi:hypothetical protein
MLIPDNINPNDTIYYNWYIIFKNIKQYWEKDIIDLYEIIKKEINISFSLYILCLDWLFLINLAILNKNNLIEPCL